MPNKSNDKPKSTWGGKRPGAGRRYLNGSAPGEGEAAVKVTITIPREMADWLRRLGDDNLSAGVREAVGLAQELREVVERGEAMMEEQEKAASEGGTETE